MLDHIREQRDLIEAFADLLHELASLACVCVFVGVVLVCAAVFGGVQ